MNFVKTFFDSLKGKVDSVVEEKRNESKSSSSLLDKDNMNTNDLGKTADNFLNQIEIALKAGPGKEHELQRLIDLFNSLVACYLKMNMNKHALLKLNELEKYPGISLSANYDFLFFKAKALYRLDKFRDALECCYHLKALCNIPSESLDKAILHLEAKVQKEVQNGLSDKHFVASSQKRDVSVPRISNLVSDIIPNNSLPPKKDKVDNEFVSESFLKSQKSVMELLSFDEESNAPSVDSKKMPQLKRSNTRVSNRDGITRLKELAEKGVIKPPTYEEISQKPFVIKCTVYFGPKRFETIKSAPTKRQAKHCAADAMIKELENVNVI